MLCAQCLSLSPCPGQAECDMTSSDGAVCDCVMASRQFILSEPRLICVYLNPTLTYIRKKMGLDEKVILTKVLS